GGSPRLDEGRDGRLHVERQRTLRAAVQIHALAEDGEAGAELLERGGGTRRVGRRRCDCQNDTDDTLAPATARMPLTSGDQHRDVTNEQVLSRQLSATQQTTMALGGAIGTGLFLASGLSVYVARPAIILSAAIRAGVPR